MLNEKEKNRTKKQKGLTPPSKPAASPPPPQILSFGEYKNIKLTQEHYDDLVNKHGKEKINQVITESDLWLETNGKKKKNYKAFLQVWMRRVFASPKKLSEDITEKNKAWK